ncbi:hypothetical protein SAMN05518856_109177 [Paenibacillus sp. OK003]|uniref:Uncharacterized protein n=1 Tax=Paenibacillus pabuli TaxID=1472 RepID=A0ABX9BC72_9BACL|nr:hypothetical protein DET54_1219 [Paenibacillus pabuli]SEL29366.1 hypothetical protein SAMN05518856_109177 [Paenibacillus sp. OK003]
MIDSSMVKNSLLMNRAVYRLNISSNTGLIT